MKRFRYHYENSVTFSSPVKAHTWLQRCLPRYEQFQRPETTHFCAEAGEENFAPIPFQERLDGLGNPLRYGHVQDRHTAFRIVSDGIVRQTPYRICDSSHGMFLAATALTAPGPEMLEAVRSLPRPHENFGAVFTHLSSTLNTALAAASAVHDTMTYAPGTTDVATPAAVAFARKNGVCQDYAHIVIGMVRCLGIPARYVCGFLPGEGATHAWVEVFDNGVWRGLDPTHNRLIDYGCIKVAHGRDSDDCPVNRGIFTGLAKQQQHIVIKVEAS